MKNQVFVTKDTPDVVRLIYRHLCKLFDSRESYLKNKSTIIERSRVWRNRNPEKFKKSKNKYRKSNQEKIRAMDRAYQLKRRKSIFGEMGETWSYLNDLKKEIRRVEKEKA